MKTAVSLCILFGWVYLTSVYATSSSIIIDTSTDQYITGDMDGDSGNGRISGPQLSRNNNGNSSAGKGAKVETINPNVDGSNNLNISNIQNNTNNTNNLYITNNPNIPPSQNIPYRFHRSGHSPSSQYNPPPYYPYPYPNSYNPYPHSYNPYNPYQETASFPLPRETPPLPLPMEAPPLPREAPPILPLPPSFPSSPVSSYQGTDNEESKLEAPEFEDKLEAPEFEEIQDNSAPITYCWPYGEGLLKNAREWSARPTFYSSNGNVRNIKYCAPNGKYCPASKRQYKAIPRLQPIIHKVPIIRKTLNRGYVSLVRTNVTTGLESTTVNRTIKSRKPEN